MSHRRQLGLWIALAAVATLLFMLVMRTQYQPTQERFALNVDAHPAIGREVFETKGCARCHGSDAAGTADGPSLRNHAALTSSARLVTALWNHVPRMAEAMRAVHMPYPTMTNEQTGQLLSFLFVTGLTDDSGDERRGSAVFVAKRCVVCHRDGGGAPLPSRLGSAESPLAFTGSLWNHAAAMQAEMQRKGVNWPRLDAADVRDLFAYVQFVAGNKGAGRWHAADPARGWTLFQSRGCIECHALRGRETSLPMRVNPDTAPQPVRVAVRVTKEISPADAPPLPVLGRSGREPGDSDVPPALSEFGAAMLNHFPKMRVAMNGQGGGPPKFSSGDLADLAVFLYGLRNTEPGGSPYVGASVFVWRGCAACHGAQATGGSGPALRGRGQTYTAVRLATGLWVHGDRMYAEARRSGQPWPHLEDSDIGDLLAFLNTPVQK